MKRGTLIACVAALVAVLGGGAYAVKKRSDDTKAQAQTAAGAKGAAPGSPMAASSTATSAELSANDIITVQAQDLRQGLPITGSLKAANSAVVKAKVPGELKGLVVREGDAVKLGQLLATIDSTDFALRVKQAQDQAAAAKAQSDIAQRQFDNNKALVDQGFISKTSLDTSQATLNAARATYQAALAGTDVAKKSVADTEVRAPIGGQISQRLAQPGERVGIDARIVEIVDLSRLEMESAVATSDAAGLRVGQTARVAIEGISAPVEVTIVRINPTAQASNRSVLTYLSVPRIEGLRQGLFAQGSLGTAKIRAAALPLTAVRTDKPAPYVQAVVDGKVVHVPVTLGARGDADGEPMVAVTGIAEGAKVLAGNLGLVRDGTAIRFTPTQDAKGIAATARP